MPFLAASPTGANSAVDIFAVGKTINICMLGLVTMEIMIVARYWTWWFGAVCVLSYALVFPFVLLFPLFQQVLDTWDMAQFGVGINVMRTPYFWISLITVYSVTFSIRYFERSTKWLFRPDDNMIRAELEVRAHSKRGKGGAGSGSGLSESVVPDLEDGAGAGAGASDGAAPGRAASLHVRPVPSHVGATVVFSALALLESRSVCMRHSGARDNARSAWRVSPVWVARQNTLRAVAVMQASQEGLPGVRQRSTRLESNGHDPAAEGAPATLDDDDEPSAYTHDSRAHLPAHRDTIVAVQLLFTCHVDLLLVKAISSSYTTLIDFHDTSFVQLHEVCTESE